MCEQGSRPAARTFVALESAVAAPAPLRAPLQRQLHRGVPRGKRPAPLQRPLCYNGSFPAFSRKLTIMSTEPSIPTAALLRQRS